MVYQLSYSNIKTYFLAAIFVVGNIVLPQLCHLIPQGGLILLPIYFFTLIAAYKYGIYAGLITAICSPTINNILFGMPPEGMLPIILIKSVLLAVAASFIASKYNKVTLFSVALSVILYQSVGTIFEWIMTGSLTTAMQDIILGYPGILIQIFLGYLLMKHIDRV